MPAALPEGLRFHPAALGRAAQAALIEVVLAAAVRAPFVTPAMPKSGAPMSVMQTSLGSLGWVSDQARGYRYEPRHPETGAPWPPLIGALLDLWDRFSSYGAPPETCLVNLYRGPAKMGLHVDADEAAEDAPVVSVSLGDEAMFRIGGAIRRAPTSSLRLASGDVLVMAGAARRSFHGIDRILPGSSTIVPGGGRINLTLRRVSVPPT